MSSHSSSPSSPLSDVIEGVGLWLCGRSFVRRRDRSPLCVTAHSSSSGVTIPEENQVWTRSKPTKTFRILFKTCSNPSKPSRDPCKTVQIPLKTVQIPENPECYLWGRKMSLGSVSSSHLLGIVLKLRNDEPHLRLHTAPRPSPDPAGPERQPDLNRDRTTVRPDWTGTQLNQTWTGLQLDQTEPGPWSVQVWPGECYLGHAPTLFPLASLHWALSEQTPLLDYPPPTETCRRERSGYWPAAPPQAEEGKTEL